MIKLSKKILPTASERDRIVLRLEEKLKGLDSELTGSVVMAANELLENAVKYHMEKGISSKILFKLIVRDKIRISVTNRLFPGDDASLIVDQIHRINDGTDPGVKYRNRLKEIMENRVPGESRLGLLRIAGEGRFSLAYMLNNGRLSVSAEKYYCGKRKDIMESLITKDFSIVIKGNDPVEILWSGRSRDLDPSLLLDNYLSEILPQLYDREVVVDFTSMDSLNSSTIPPILTFLTNLEKSRVGTTVLYSKDIYWQRASFRPLTVLIRDFVYVKIQAV